MAGISYYNDSLNSGKDHLTHSLSSTLTQSSIPHNALSEDFKDSHSDQEGKPDNRTTTKMKAFIKSYYSCDSFLPPLDLSKVAEYSCSGVLSKDDLKRFIHPDISNHLSGSDIEPTDPENDLETGADLAANLLVQAKILHQRALISEDKAKIVEQELAEANLELKKTCQRYQALNASHQEMRDQFWDLELHIQGLNAQIHNLITTNENLTEENQDVSRKLAHAMDNLTHLKDRETELMESLDAGMKKYDSDTAELHRTILKMHEDLNILERQSLPYKSPSREQYPEYQYNSHSRSSTAHNSITYDAPTSPINSDRRSDYQSNSNSTTKSPTQSYHNYDRTLSPAIERRPESQYKSNSSFNSNPTSKSYTRSYSPHQQSSEYLYQSYGKSNSSQPPRSYDRPSTHRSLVLAKDPPVTPQPTSHDRRGDYPEQLRNSDSIPSIKNSVHPGSYRKPFHGPDYRERMAAPDGSVADSGYDGSFNQDTNYPYEGDQIHLGPPSSDDERSSAIRPYKGYSAKPRVKHSDLQLRSSSHPHSRQSSKVPAVPPKSQHRKSCSTSSVNPAESFQKEVRKPSSHSKSATKDRSVDHTPSKSSRSANYQVCTYQVPTKRNTRTRGMSRKWEIISNEFNTPGSKKLASRVFDLGDRLLIQEILKDAGSESELEHGSEEENSACDEDSAEIEQEVAEEEPLSDEEQSVSEEESAIDDIESLAEQESIYVDDESRLAQSFIEEPSQLDEEVSDEEALQPDDDEEPFDDEEQPFDEEEIDQDGGYELDHPYEKEEVIFLGSFQQNEKANVPNLTTRRQSILSLRGALSSSPSSQAPIGDRRKLSGLNPASLALPVSSADMSSLTQSNLSQSPVLPTQDIPCELAPTGLAGYFSDVAQAVQDVMAGEFLYKSSRGILGQERRSLRFVWVNPQAKYIYWSETDPGTQRTLYMDPSRPRSGARSAFICGVRLISDPWSSSSASAPTTGIALSHSTQPPALSIVIDTPGQSIKLKARTEASHKLWETALFYLQSTVPTLLTRVHSTPASVSGSNSISSHAPSIKSGTGPDPVATSSADLPMAIQGIQRGHFVPSPAKQKRMTMFQARGNW